jgi:hypothetical protein
VRAKQGIAVSRYIGAFVFLLLLVKDFFPTAALAFTSANSCFKDTACRILLQEAFRSSVKAPLDTDSGNAEPINVIDSSGVAKTSVNGFAGLAMVVGPSPAYATFHYWDQVTNGLAQNKAREKYCTANPNDLVCVPFAGGQCEGMGYEYGWEAEVVGSDGTNYGYTGNTAGNRYWSYAVWGPIRGIRIVDNTIEVLARGPYYRHPTPNLVWVTGYSTWHPYTLRNARFRNILRWDGSADNCGNPPPLAWKDWPQAKRDAAVALLTDSEWQRLANSMPEGVRLAPGDTVIAKDIVIPGQDLDNPDTLGDDSQLKTVPGQHTKIPYPDNDHDTNPDSSDPDDDDDGIPDTDDARPLNPFPIASSDEDPVVNEPPAPGQPGSPEHKAQRWAEYQEEGGEWNYERWSKVYDINMVRAKEAGAARDAYHQEIGWGKTEVTVDANGEIRRLDIADVETKRGVEYKTGYTYASEENLSELRRDEFLTKQKTWKIEWVFEGTASEPLLQALRDAGIPYKFRKP